MASATATALRDGNRSAHTKEIDLCDKKHAARQPLLVPAFCRPGLLHGSPSRCTRALLPSLSISLHGRPLGSSSVSESALQLLLMPHCWC